MTDKPEQETLQQIKQRALNLLRQGDFSLAERLLERGDATLQELTENLRIYQVELEAQAAELRESQQRLASTLDRFERLFQSLPLPALVTDLFGMVRQVNAAAARSLGLRQQRWGETSVFRCVAEADDRTRLHAALVQAAETGAVTLGEVRLTMAGPTVAVCDLSIERLARSEAAPGADELVLTVIDQTERLQALRQLQAANDELRRQELDNARLAEVARLTGQVVLTTDAQRRITWVNDAFTRVTGYTADEVIGRTPGRLLQGPGTDPAVVARIAQRLAQGEAVEHEEILNYAKDGRPYWLLLDIRAVRDAQGVVQQFVAVETDITERRRAEEALRASEERLRAVFDAEPNGVMVVQRDGRVREINAAGARLLQAASPADLVGRLAIDFVCSEDREAMATLHQQVLLGGRPAELRCCIVGVGGGRLPIHAHSVPLHSGGQIDGWLAIMRDLSQELEAERLRVEKDVAEEANRAKTQFLSRMSHELRTPLNAVLGFAQLLDGDLERTPAAVQHERLGHIQRAGWQLLAMINDVLDLSRIESDQIALEMSSVPLAQAAAAAVALVTPAAQRRGLRLQVRDEDPGACAWADPVRLGQVLNNLMSNAVKYNRPGGWVELRIAGRHDEVTLEVSDSGPGLNAEQRQHLFEPFNRLGAERGAIEGTGIGLVIARRLVELMGGRIDVDEARGGGACFRVTLRAGAPAWPAEDAATPQPAARPVPAPSGRRRRLLCVEDDPVNVEVVRAALEDQTHWDLVVATDGAGALQAVRAQRPELVLLDLQLPDMTGLEVRRQLLADPATAALPCILLTADATPAARSAAEAAGFHRILLKPVSLVALLGAICELLGEAAV